MGDLLRDAMRERRAGGADRSGTAALEWYLIRLRPGGLPTAQAHLARQGFAPFAPMTETTRRRAGHFFRARVPLFPGYVFAGRGPASAGPGALAGTRGVAAPVRFGSGPLARVPGALVRELQLACGADGIFRGAARLAPGSEVRVAAGPFAACLGRIEGAAPQDRVWLLVEAMGQSARVAVPRSDLSVSAEAG